MIPHALPRITAAKGSVIISLHAAIITPPAIVAFRMISMSRRLFISLAVAHALMQLALIDRAVLIIMRCCEIAGAKAALKLGQYM